MSYCKNHFFIRLLTFVIKKLTMSYKTQTLDLVKDTVSFLSSKNITCDQLLANLSRCRSGFWFQLASFCFDCPDSELNNAARYLISLMQNKNSRYKTDLEDSMAGRIQTFNQTFRPSTLFPSRLEPSRSEILDQNMQIDRDIHFDRSIHSDQCVDSNRRIQIHRDIHSERGIQIDRDIHSDPDIQIDPD